MCKDRPEQSDGKPDIRSALLKLPERAHTAPPTALTSSPLPGQTPDTVPAQRFMAHNPANTGFTQVEGGISTLEGISGFSPSNLIHQVMFLVNGRAQSASTIREYSKHHHLALPLAQARAQSASRNRGHSEPDHLA